MRLWHKVTLGLILGILFGAVCSEYGNVEYTEALKPVGDIFLRLIKMVVYPLIFFSIVSGVTSMSDPASLGRVGFKAIIAYTLTTFFAVLFGLTVGNLLRPGDGVDIKLSSYNNGNFRSEKFDLLEFIVNIFPDNISNSFSQGNIIQIVFFALFTGYVLNSIGSVADPIKNAIHTLSRVVLAMISKIIELSPYGAFALTAWVVGRQGIDVMASLSKLVLAIIVAMVLQYLIFGLAIMLFCRISPIPFYKKSFEYQVIAFSTGSSKASLSTTMEVCRNKLGVSESSTSFVLPLGASINMDGFAINLGLTAIFFAQMMGVDLSINDYMVIIFTATVGSIGGAGIPGASLIMLPLVLSSVNMPINSVDAVALIAGIDRVLDLLRSAINITGDATITLIIDDSEGSLDKEKYYSEL